MEQKLNYFMKHNNNNDNLPKQESTIIFEIFPKDNALDAPFHVCVCVREREEGGGQFKLRMLQWVFFAKGSL